MSNTSIAAPAICLFFNTLIKACSSTIGPRDALIKPGRWLHSLQLRGAYQAARTAAQHQMDRQDVGPLEQLVLGNQDCARSVGNSSTLQRRVPRAWVLSPPPAG